MGQDDREKQLQMLNAIARIQKSVYKNVELGQIAADLVKEMSSLLVISGCAVIVVNADGSPGVLAQEGFSQTHRAEQLLDDDSLIRHTLTAGQQVITDDVCAEADLSARLPVGWPARSLMCLPLTGGDQTRGLFYLESMSEGGFGEEEQDFLQMMVDLLSLAIERSELHSRIEALTANDSLTGCLKRARIEEDVNNEIARSKRYRRPLSLVLIALSRVEELQRICGQEEGDRLLKELGALFVRFKRNTDSIYRYDEGQFIALLPETDTKSALKMAQRIGEAVEQGGLVPETNGQVTEGVTVNTAVASYPWDGNNPGELLESARAALQQVRKGDDQQIGQKVTQEKMSER